MYGSRFATGRAAIPEAPVAFVLFMGVAALLLILYAVGLVRASGWTGVARNYFIAAAAVIAIAVLFAIERF
jgi:hypothetical protein